MPFHNNAYLHQMEQMVRAGELDIEEIPMDDKATWDMICEGETKGCFQIESHLGKTWSKRLKPRNILELAALVSLIRPGCISGDTKIWTRISTRSNKNGVNRYKAPIRELFKNKGKYKTIVSYNEETGEFVHNDVEDIFYTGQKPVFKVNVSQSLYQNRRSTKSYDLKCTADHKLLTPNGWVELQNLTPGDRIAIAKYRKRDYPSNGSKYFREICFQNYDYKCVFCDWEKGSLDVNHLEGNRHTDNSPENLCFLCPNHHRMYSEKSITKEEITETRKNLYIGEKEDVIWGQYLGNEECGETDVYDITMKAPYHNFVAGNIVVHNCLKAKSEDGKSMTEHYCDRKMGKERVTSLHESIDDILAETYGIIVFQEQSMQIAQQMAKFNLQDADKLRKAMGKKDADLMDKVTKWFVEGCAKNGISEAVARNVADIIEKSNRYSFNKSHAVGYAIMCYWSAWLRANHIIPFFKRWLGNAKEKLDPMKETKELVISARRCGIDIKAPSLRVLEKNFSCTKSRVFFGLCNVKYVGENEFEKLKARVEEFDDVEQITLADLLFRIFPHVNKRTIESLITVGTFDLVGIPRTRILHEFKCSHGLTKREKEWLENNYIQAGLIENITRMIEPLKVNSRRQTTLQDLIRRIEVPGRVLHDNPVIYTEKEENLLGVALSYSRLDGSLAKSHANATCKDLAQGRQGDVFIAVEINEFREFTTKNGDLMGFLKVSDETYDLENTVIFPKQFEEFGELLYDGNTVLLKCANSKDRDRESVIIEKVYQI